MHLRNAMNFILMLFLFRIQTDKSLLKNSGVYSRTKHKHSITYEKYTHKAPA